MKNLRKLREEHGAGEWGTPELTNKYKSETPGEKKEGLEKACWKGYEAIGTKQKNGKTVPNCVPKEGHAEDAQAAHQAAHAALKKGDIDTYHKEMDKKFASHQAGEKEAAKKPVKTYEATEFKPNAGTLAQIKKDHEELKNKSTKDILAIHQGQHRVRSNYTAAEIGGKHAMIGDILRNRHGDKHVSHYYSMNEDSDEQKNLKITKHEKAAVEAGKKGDKQAQQYHLNAVKNLKTESVNEATEKKELKHLVTVTVSDPHHTMQSKRKEKIMKRVRVSAADPKTAVAKAEAHYKKHGYKVHDSLHHSIVESLDTDEFIDSKDQATRGKDDDEDDITNNPAFTDTEDEKGLPKEVSFGESTEQDNGEEENETGLSDEEKTQLGKIKTLIRLGLIDGSQMQITLRAVKKLDLDQPVTSSQERQAINTLLQQLIGVVTGDDTVFRKIRLNVQK